MLPNEATRGGSTMANRVLQSFRLALDLAPSKLSAPRVILHERLVH